MVRTGYNSVRTVDMDTGLHNFHGCHKNLLKKVTVCDVEHFDVGHYGVANHGVTLCGLSAYLTREMIKIGLLLLLHYVL